MILSPCAQTFRASESECIGKKRAGRVELRAGHVDASLEGREKGPILTQTLRGRWAGRGPSEVDGCRHAFDDSVETFEFSGLLTLEWKDPRQAFEPRDGAIL
jgi:hypothetical protein